MRWSKLKLLLNYISSKIKKKIIICNNYNVIRKCNKKNLWCTLIPSGTTLAMFQIDFCKLLVFFLCFILCVSNKLHAVYYDAFLACCSFSPFV